MARTSGTKLTVKQLDGIKANNTLQRLRDELQPGLTFVVSKGGAKAWSFAYTSPEGKGRRTIGLGKYTDTGLLEARNLASDYRKIINKGVDPLEEQSRETAVIKKEEQDAFLARVEISDATLGKLMALYVDKLTAENKLTTAKDVESVVERDIPHKLQLAPAANIVKEDVTGIMRGITTRAQLRGKSGERRADMTRGYIMAAYNIALKDNPSPRWEERLKVFSGIKYNPVDRVGKYQSGTVADTSEERTLTRDESATLYNSVGVDAMRIEMALYIKLAYHLGGQRVLELLEASWKEFDLKQQMWSIPMSRRKIRHKARHKEPHLVPLTKTAIELLTQLKEYSGDKYLFPTSDGKAPATPATLGQAVKRFCIPTGKSTRTPFDVFTPRDLRRTVKTLMGEAKLDTEIRKRIQGHAFGDVAAIHYDRYDFIDEKIAAMKKWERWLNKQIKAGRKS